MHINVQCPDCGCGIDIDVNIAEGHRSELAASLRRIESLLMRVLAMDAEIAAVLKDIDADTTQIGQELSDLAGKVQSGSVDKAEIVTALQQRADALKAIATANDPNAKTAAAATEAAATPTPGA